MSQETLPTPDFATADEKKVQKKLQVGGNKKWVAKKVFENFGIPRAREGAAHCQDSRFRLWPHNK